MTINATRDDDEVGRAGAGGTASGRPGSDPPHAAIDTTAAATAATRRGREARTSPLAPADREAAVADEGAIAVVGARAEPRPDVPPVVAAGKPVAPTAMRPRATQLELGTRRPRAEHLGVSTEQLHVVVAGASLLLPAQERGLPETRSGGWFKRRRSGPHRPRRGVSSRVVDGDRVRVPHAGLHQG